MVKIMIKKNSFYKGNNILTDNYKDRLFNYFNPYEYNFESDIRDKENTDITYQKSKSHSTRNNTQK